jgi:hypothetical protein
VILILRMLIVNSGSFRDFIFEAVSVDFTVSVHTYPVLVRAIVILMKVNTLGPHPRSVHSCDFLPHKRTKDVVQCLLLRQTCYCLRGIRDFLRLNLCMEDRFVGSLFNDAFSVSQTI